MSNFFLRNKCTVITMYGTVALRSANKNFAGELQFCSYGQSTSPRGMSLIHSTVSPYFWIDKLKYDKTNIYSPCYQIRDKNNPLQSQNEWTYRANDHGRGFYPQTILTRFLILDYESSIITMRRVCNILGLNGMASNMFIVMDELAHSMMLQICLWIMYILHNMNGQILVWSEPCPLSYQKL